jgi:hypothetical protein
MIRTLTKIYTFERLQLGLSNVENIDANTHLRLIYGKNLIYVERFV